MLGQDMMAMLGPTVALMDGCPPPPPTGADEGSPCCTTCQDGCGGYLSATGDAGAGAGRGRGMHGGALPREEAARHPRLARPPHAPRPAVDRAPVRGGRHALVRGLQVDLAGHALLRHLRHLARPRAGPASRRVERRVRAALAARGGPPPAGSRAVARQAGAPLRWSSLPQSAAASRAWAFRAR